MNYAKLRIGLIACMLTLGLAACGSGSSPEPPPQNGNGNDNGNDNDNGQSLPDISTAHRCNINSNNSGQVTSAWENTWNGDMQPGSEPLIKLNQLGYLPSSQKLALVPSVDATTFTVIDANSDAVVHSGNLSSSGNWSHANMSVQIADFSGLTAPGVYQVRVDGLPDSWAFPIDENAYLAVNDAALKAFYFNRASTELLAEHAGIYARPMGHPDNNVQIHASAATNLRPEGTVFASPRGWYDAGDFGKYVVNSGITMHSLLSAYEHFGDHYRAQYLNIPESGDTMPDILHEALWNLEWMLTMQDPNDGGVYHKLTTANFAGAIMPHNASAQRYAIGKGTASTLNFAAVMAMASRIYADYEDQCPGLAQEMLEAAEYAWTWAQANPNVPFTNPPGINTGEYGGSNLPSARAWAAAELYITTGNDDYYSTATGRPISVPGWTQSDALAWMSLAHHRDNLTAIADVTLIENRILNEANAQLNYWQNHPARITINSFFWGSNAYGLNQAMMLIQGYRVDPGNRDYLHAAQSMLDYVLGRNATDYSFVTGHGSFTPMHPHHRVSEADNNEHPVPGFVVGGPHNQVQSDCGAANYPSNQPARSYLDHWCSYSTNEVAINWNAPLTYVTGAIQVLTNE